MFKKILLALSVVAVMAFTSCSGGQSPFTVDDATFQLHNPMTIVYLKNKGKSSLEGDVTAATASMSNFQSSNPSVATVNPISASGVIALQATEAGSTTITMDVKSGNKTHTISFEVTIIE